MNEIAFEAQVERYGDMGEKTGWYVLPIPAGLAAMLHAENKKSFRVKGFINELEIDKMAMIPMGNGDYVLPLNAELRKKLGCRQGHTIQLRLQKDASEILLNQDLVDTLEMNADAALAFYKLPKSHQHYYSKWISSAKTEATQTKRILQCLKAMEQNLSFGEAMKMK